MIVAADSVGYRQRRQTKVFNDSPEIFTAPVLANGRIYCRSDTGEVLRLELNREK